MKKDDFISPLEDFAFKQIFGEKRNIDNTKEFLKTILNFPEDEFGSLSIGNPVLSRMFKKEKEGIVDIKLEAKSGKIFHIELQVQKKAFLRNRVLYYGARLVSDQLKWSEKYRKMHHVISIVICDHVLLEEEADYMNVYELKNDKKRNFTDLLKLVIIELPKIPEEEDSAIWPWLRFLKCEDKEECEILARKYPQLKKPVRCVKRMNVFEIISDIQFHRRLWKEDERMLHLQWKLDGIAEGKIEGRAVGIEEGRAEGREELRKEKLAIARNLLNEGSTPEFIQKITGLSLDEIAKL